jgi:hypothetical protein
MPASRVLSFQWSAHYILPGQSLDLDYEVTNDVGLRSRLSPGWLQAWRDASRPGRSAGLRAIWQLPQVRHNGVRNCAACDIICYWTMVTLLYRLALKRDRGWFCQEAQRCDHQRTWTTAVPC